MGRRVMRETSVGTRKSRNHEEHAAGSRPARRLPLYCGRSHRPAGAQTRQSRILRKPLSGDAQVKQLVSRIPLAFHQLLVCLLMLLPSCGGPRHDGADLFGRWEKQAESTGHLNGDSSPQVIEIEIIPDEPNYLVVSGLAPGERVGLARSDSREVLARIPDEGVWICSKDRAMLFEFEGEEATMDLYVLESAGSIGEALGSYRRVSKK